MHINSLCPHCHRTGKAELLYAEASEGHLLPTWAAQWGRAPFVSCEHCDKTWWVAICPHCNGIHEFKDGQARTCCNNIQWSCPTVNPPRLVLEGLATAMVKGIWNMYFGDGLRGRRYRLVRGN
jgi:hypothetical protein